MTNLDDLEGAEELTLGGDRTQRPPRCPECCTHGIRLEQVCGWCEDEWNGMTDCIVWPWEEQWLCILGIGKR
jgi:hypothetical protein